MAAKTRWLKANLGKTPTQSNIVQQLYQTSYNKAILDGGKGTGSAIQRGISAASALAARLVGLAENSASSAVTNAQAGKNAVEDNALCDGWNNILPSGTIDCGQSVQYYAQYSQDECIARTDIIRSGPNDYR